MAKIEVLPDDLINKIAAGEVVDRPVSIVKELVENSLDSGADSVTIIVEDGGKSLIQIKDNGCGMGEDDLLLAFERHATSKVKNYNDLLHLSSMGFRGEALPSIASVSMVEMSSKVKGSESGNIISIKGGQIQSVKPTAMTASTDIKIKSLFFNVPARRKFLKDPQKEYKFIYTYFKKLALSRPDVNLKFISNERTVFDLKKENINKRISSIFREINSESLIYLSKKFGDIKVSGFIGKKEISRKTKENQFLFVNNRIIENKNISYAVFQGYRNLIEPGYYPFYVLFIDIPSDQVDVNVHPSKMEAKFQDENGLSFFIKNIVFEELSGQQTLVNISFSDNDVLRDTDYNFKNNSKIEEIVKEQELFENLSTETFREEKDSYKPFENYKSAVEEENQTKILEKEPFLRPERKGIDILKFNNESIVSENIWQLHNKYIFMEMESGVTIIDQHVAQERIFFEKAMKSFDNMSMNSQILLFPVKVDLSFEDAQVLEEIHDYLTSVGFTISNFGGSSYIIEGTPIGISYGEEERELKDIIDYYIKYREKKMSIRESVAASYACKRSIKAGDKLTKDEMLSLIHDLFMCKFPHVCPHGRPIIVNLNLKEIDKKFLRT
ncbi:MAG: DNA mismatch repair endonuclease MutL [Candidatus Delongbacteria bacterium]|nr:DNA mismatch repair endonuclease MutL [Candidatus Delongbacteria bacterium]MBN2833781.1 DNA mismatch repair endonuclease MutL [Candidatus Delongbacteria bacterium]